MAMAVKLEKRLNPSTAMNVIVPVLSIIAAFLVGADICWDVDGSRPAGSLYRHVQGGAGLTIRSGGNRRESNSADALRTGDFGCVSNAALEYRR